MMLTMTCNNCGKEKCAENSTHACKTVPNTMDELLYCHGDCTPPSTRFGLPHRHHFVDGKFKCGCAYEKRCPECPTDSKWDAFTPVWCEKHRPKEA